MRASSPEKSAAVDLAGALLLRSPLGVFAPDLPFRFGGSSKTSDISLSSSIIGVPTLATATGSASALSLVGASLNGDSDPEAGSATGVRSFGLPFPLGVGFDVPSDLAFFLLGCLGSLSEAEMSSSSSS